MSIAYRPEIDGLRAIAVLSVVAFHYDETALPGGFLGVDLFFVISGYLITSIIFKEIDGRGFSFWTFYARRARRILPALLAMVLGVLVAAYAISPPEDAARIALSAVAAVGFAANFHFRDQADYFAIPAVEEPLLHSWSLAVEEQFYLLWPLLLILLAGSWRRRRLAVALGLVAVGWALSAWLSVRAPDIAFYYLPARLWELAAGAAVAAGSARAGAARFGDLGVAAGLALILFGLVFSSQAWPTPAISAAPVVLGGALVLAFGANARGPASAALRIAPMRGVGLISYSLYLWHWPVLSFASALAPERGAHETALLLALTAALSIGSYRFVEQPFRRPAGRWQESRPAVAAALLAMVATAGVAATSLMSDGWSWRGDTDARLAAFTRKDPRRAAPLCIHRFGPEHDARCNMGAETPGGFDLLLIGDSHADHYARAIGDLAAARGLSARLLSSGACPPIDGIRVRKWADIAFCDAFRAAWRAAPRSRAPEAKLIVLAARWAFYFEPLDFDGAPHHRFVVIGEDGADLPRAAHFDRVVAAFETTLDALLAETGARILILGQAPPLRAHAELCVARTLWRGGDPALCREEAGRVTARLARSEAALAALAASRPRVEHIRMDGAFCDAEHCRAIADGRLLYRDTNHLSAFGADWLVRRVALGAVFDRALDQTRGR